MTNSPWDRATGALDIATLKACYADGRLTPETLIDAIYDRIAARGEDHVWIHLIARETSKARARALMADPCAVDLPLYGIPFGIKDNIDLAGLPTTAAVRAWARMADTTSPLVQTLLDAGAIPIGKQNQDQLGMGVVGVRSDYGIPQCCFDSRYISGGSTSGGGVSVGAGLVSFAVANDAAGSGRVPAALNNIVGYKPTPGLIPRARASLAGMVGTENFLTLTMADSVLLTNLWFAYEPSDPFSKPQADGFRITTNPAPDTFRFAIPDEATLDTDGDGDSERLFRENVARLRALGGTAVPIDMTPYLTAARMLYDGPFIAQRYANFGDKFDGDEDALCPATREILSWGRNYTARDVFKAQYVIAGYKQQIRALFKDVDLLVTPTSPSTYTIEALLADNIALNARMGTYTNFVNLLDLPAVSIPAGFRKDGIPLGTMLIGPSLGDDLICRIGGALHAALGIAPGIAGRPAPAA
ncbi:amidase family protein [Salipiger sp. 1_MG-2023]|uniref:amidase family protein n=1 Tax=Salipiger sp. 1_MG-2023 TaxID=3062665 RepID=UPI0026E17D02|nr:amidase family protein [Salipiger sp. 1_MG-2023]MDO6584670.1 amidase family protein [Salipiger sp. 1_MG-2023]